MQISILYIEVKLHKMNLIKSSRMHCGYGMAAKKASQ